MVAQAKEEGKEAGDAVEPVMRTVSKSSEDWQVQNDSKPLWTRSPREVSTLPPPVRRLTSPVGRFPPLLADFLPY